MESHSCGAATYQLIHILVAPDKPTDKNYAEIMAVIKAHDQPHPSTIVQRFVGDYHSTVKTFRVL